MNGRQVALYKGLHNMNLSVHNKRITTGSCVIPHHAWSYRLNISKLTSLIQSTL